MSSSSPTEPTTAGEPPPPPDAAAAVFATALPVACAYAALLAGPGVTRGLIGPREVPRLWERHLLNCAVLDEAIEPGVRVADLGSGAGLPGIPLALARPDLELTLIEPLLRRSAFLHEAVGTLGLSVAVRRARAEELAAERPGFDVVVARAVAPLPQLLRWSLPLLRPGGVLLALKGARAPAELAALRAAGLPRGVVGADIRVLGAGRIDPPATAVTISRAGRSPHRRPVTLRRGPTTQEPIR